MQCRYNRHFQFAQEGQDMAASRAAEDSELVLDGDNIHVAGVEEVGSAPARIQILLLNLEANHVRILIAPVDVIDRHRETPALGMLHCYSPKQVGCKRGDAAFARQVVPEKRDGSDAGGYFQNLDRLFLFCCFGNGGRFI
jgi:hypothetical protein